VFGANASPYQRPGDWQVSVAARNLVSDDHYNGTIEQRQRQQNQNYIRNTQNLFDIGVTRVISRRVSVTLGIPFVYSAWSFRDPSSPLPGPRVDSPQWGRGLGDISVTSRAWIFNPSTHPDWNVAAGGGLKFPTGNEAYKDSFVDVRGAVQGILGNPVQGFVRNEIEQYVDQSVQPGDGGWGIMTDVQAFWRVKKVLLFGSGSYLVNPQDTNDTPSILTVLGINTTTGPNAGLGVNSIPDQYLARLGGTVEVWKGVSASLAWRMEGLRRYDLFGDSHGWRRPGTAMFVEPGFSYSVGPHSISLHVPIGYYYKRHANPYTGNPGDATFPRQVFLTSYAFRLGRSARPPATDQPNVPTTPPATPVVPQSDATTGIVEGISTPASPSSSNFCLPAVHF
jgi:hypothetical protein